MTGTLTLWGPVRAWKNASLLSLRLFAMKLPLLPQNLKIIGKKGGLTTVVSFSECNMTSSEKPGKPPEKRLLYVSLWTKEANQLNPVMCHSCRFATGVFLLLITTLSRSCCPCLSELVWNGLIGSDCHQPVHHSRCSVRSPAGWLVRGPPDLLQQVHCWSGASYAA